MSTRQQAILDFIQKQVKTKGYPPSVREIGNAVGLASTSTVHAHLTNLEKKGFIRRDPTKPRAIEILNLHDKNENKQTEVVHIPVVGKVTAGIPITAIENIEDYFPLPMEMVGNSTVFMLTVEGNSMIEAGILDGDYVIVRQQANADNGDIVVAMTDENEATVKRFYKEEGHFRLQPENINMQPIILQNVHILGKVISLYRKIEE